MTTTANLPGSIFDGAEIISAYSRRQAIEDGVLVQLSGPGYEGNPCIPETVAEAGFRYPIAMTREAFARYVWPIENPKEEKWLGGHYQDMQGRLWDVLTMLKYAIRRSNFSGLGDRHGDMINFEFRCVVYKRSRPSVCHLKAVCGPDDDGSPCITVMLPEQD